MKSAKAKTAGRIPIIVPAANMFPKLAPSPEGAFLCPGRGARQVQGEKSAARECYPYQSGRSSAWFGGGWERDPRNDPAATKALAAFEAAQQAQLPSVKCYLAAVKAWRRAHPDQKQTYAAKQAVAVVLAAKVTLRIEDA